PDRHAQDIGDRSVVELVGQHFVLETLAAAYFARHFDLVHIRQLDVDDAQSLTIFVRTFRVETEQGRTNLVDFGKRLSDLVHDSLIGGGIRAAGNADRRLVNHNHVGVLPEKGLVDERAFAGAGDTGDHGQDACRYIDGDVLQVIGPGVGNRQFAFCRAT